MPVLFGRCGVGIIGDRRKLLLLGVPSFLCQTAVFRGLVCARKAVSHVRVTLRCNKKNSSSFYELSLNFKYLW